MTYPTPGVDPEQTVADVVLEHSAAAEVLQRHRIDYCCRGNLSLREAAALRGVELDGLLGELSRVIQERSDFDHQTRYLPTDVLIQHIVERHHEPLRRTLPFLQALAEKVARVHGDSNPLLRDLAVAVAELTVTLLPHLDEEEGALFPVLSQAAPDPDAARRLLEGMAEEHATVAQLLDRIRASTGDYSLPPGACTSYRTLFAELWELEADIFTHVHLENHVLLPRFVAAPQRPMQETRR